MNENKYGIFSSSIDPNQISTTILAVAKVLSGLLVFSGFLTVDDSTTLLTNLGTINTDVLIAAPLIYAVWHASVIIFGILQKIIVKLTKKTTSTASVTTTPSVPPAPLP